MRYRPAVLVAAFIAACPGAYAQQCDGPQLGTWRLLSFTSKDPETGETTAPYGLYPTGFLNYGTDCRMYQIIVREHRPLPSGGIATAAEASALYEGLMSYSGTYKVDKGGVSHHIDASWNEAWTDTIQVFQLRIDGNTLYAVAPPAKNPRDGRVTSDSLVWTRVR
jgi:hypothetical protein